MSTKLVNLNVEANGIRVMLKVNDELNISTVVPFPLGEPDSWTLGQIKQAAIELAKKQIP